jgi:hypothetical protein
MLVVVMAPGCSFGWLVHRARVQEAAVDSLERVHGQVVDEWNIKDGKYIRAGRTRSPVLGWMRSDRTQSSAQVDERRAVQVQGRHCRAPCGGASLDP